MYNIIFITAKPVSTGLHDLKDISGAYKTNAYATKQPRQWEGTIECLKAFIEACREGDNLITSVQVIHQSKINNVEFLSQPINSL